MSPGGQTFFTHRREEGEQTFLHVRGGQTVLHQEGDNHFILEAVMVTMMLMLIEIDESEANILVSEASKLFAGA